MRTDYVSRLHKSVVKRRDTSRRLQDSREIWLLLCDSQGAHAGDEAAGADGNEEGEDHDAMAQQVCYSVEYGNQHLHAQGATEETHGKDGHEQGAEEEAQSKVKAEMTGADQEEDANGEDEGGDEEAGARDKGSSKEGEAHEEEEGGKRGDGEQAREGREEERLDNMYARSASCISKLLPELCRCIKITHTTCGQHASSHLMLA